MPSPSSSSPSGGSGTSSIPTLSISSAAGDLSLVLVATAAGAAVGSLVGVYGTGAPIVWTVVGAVMAGGAVTIGLARRLKRRLDRLHALASAVLDGRDPIYLAAERDDALGRLEAQLAAAMRVVQGRLDELSVEQDRFQAILRGMVEGVLVTDLNGR